MALDPKQVELAVLLEVVELHPNHLTSAELVVKLSGERDEQEELKAAIRRLKDSGLLRGTGDVVAPTDAALRAAAILTL
jgi:hypothetical protein